MINLVEIFEDNSDPKTKKFCLRKVSVNPEHVVMMTDATAMKINYQNGYLPEDLNGEHDFTRIALNTGTGGRDLIVAGSQSAIRDKLMHIPKVLHG